MPFEQRMQIATSDIPQGEPFYQSKLNRDGDGIACEA